MKLLFTRHGHSIANQENRISNRGWRNGLSERGIGQAVALGRHLNQFHLEKIFSSPLKRAWETAQIISTATGSQIHIITGAREFDCGIAEERNDEQAWAIHREARRHWFVLGQPEYTIPGGESQSGVIQRFRGSIATITSQAVENALIVGHAGLYRLTLPAILTNLPENIFSVHHVGHTELIVTEADSGSITCSTWCGYPVSSAGELQRDISINTPRMELHPLSLEDLEEIKSTGTLTTRFQLAEGVIDESVSRPITIKVEKMITVPRVNHSWFTYWLMTMKEDQQGIGLIGFKGAMDDDGSVEIGYGIAPGYERRGLMTEAVDALTGWAFWDERCKRILASTLKQNTASQKVLLNNGFCLSGEDAVEFHYTKSRLD